MLAKAEGGWGKEAVQASRGATAPLLVPCVRKKKGNRCSNDCPPSPPEVIFTPGWLLLQGRKLQYIAASVGKLPSEQSSQLPVNYLVLVQDWGEVFLGIHDLAVYEMACWITLWKLSIPRHLQTGPSSTEVLKFRKNFTWPDEGYRLPPCQHQDWNTRLAGLQSKVRPHLSYI